MRLLHQPTQVPSAPSAPRPAAPATPAPAAQDADPRDVYEALYAQREILGTQLRSLERSRQNVAGELRRGNLSDVDRSGLEQRLASLDQQIAQVSIEIRESDAAVSAAAAVPGAVVPTPPPPSSGNQSADVAMLFIFATAVVMLPLMVAFARRIWVRADASATSAIPPALDRRFTQLEQSVEAVALEVERIGEGQRYLTKLLSARPEAQPALRAQGDAPTD